MEYQCFFSNPVNIGTDPKPDFEFAQMTCYATSTEDFQFLIEHPTSTTGNFLIEKKFTYGEIFSGILAIVLISILIFWLIKDLFFHREVSIHTIQKKSF